MLDEQLCSYSSSAELKRELSVHMWLWKHHLSTTDVNMYVYIMIDKPNFLPAVHQACSQKAKSISELEPNITDAASFPHENMYTPASEIV